MKSSCKKLILYPLSSIVFSTFLLSENTAKADITISPLVIETAAKQGQAQGNITVTNGDTKSFRSRVYTEPFTYDLETGFKLLDSSPFDLTPYLQFSPRELEVPGTDNRRIRFIARFPPSLPDGEYRTMLFTENLEATFQEEQNSSKGAIFRTAIVPRIGVAVYVRKGNISHNLTAVNARFDSKSQQLQLLVKNSGKASVITQGEWTIKKENKQIYNGRGIDTTVIAEGERYLTVDYSNAAKKIQLEPGEYQLSGNLGWGVNQTNKIPFSVKFIVP
ncbi:MAG: hypothetical protein H9536_14645 [Aphanizomenon flos-aquae Clear-A1]|jgi:hypothetical protein|nr:hypothetical protein [Aphanizomenon flos-aquae Clear-A1]OBQ21136.1 MAG: hypothetical protein AN488_10980 [Anabaena sp. WA113]